MFTFGCSTTLRLKDALAFARHYGLDLTTPVRRSETLRRVARASAIVHFKHVEPIDDSSFLVRSQSQLGIQYDVYFYKGVWDCNCPDSCPWCKHILACLWWRDQEEIFGMTGSQRMLERYHAEERSADHILK